MLAPYLGHGIDFEWEAVNVKHYGRIFSGVSYSYMLPPTDMLRPQQMFKKRHMTPFVTRELRTRG